MTGSRNMRSDPIKDMVPRTWKGNT